MKILLVHSLKTAPSDQLSLNGYDAVFSLQDRDLSALGPSSQQLQNEEAFAKELSDLMPIVREFLTDFVADVPSEAFPKWKGLSVWWATDLAKKDPESENTYFYQLVYLFFIQSLLKKNHEVEILTDDLILKKSISRNFPKLRIWAMSQYHWLSPGRLLKLGLLQWLGAIYCRLFLPKAHAQDPQNQFFISYFPNSWISSGAHKVDRHYAQLPYLDHQFDRKSVFLVFPALSKNDFKKPFALAQKMADFTRQVQRPVYFVTESLLSLLALGLQQGLYLFKLRLGPVSEMKFKINDLDATDILKPLLYSGFLNGNVFRILSQASGLAAFLKNQPRGCKVTSYSQLFPESKFFAFVIGGQRTYLTIQHAMESKNKFSNYFRAREIPKTPTPDLYFCQGSGYADILQAYFPKDKIRVIGSPKYDSYFELLKNRSALREKIIQQYQSNGKRLILLAPSVNDLEMILQATAKVQKSEKRQWLLKLHPSTDPAALRKFENLLQRLSVVLVTNPTPELLAAVDLVVCGYSTVGLEAAIFRTPSVRVQSLKRHPLFDHDSNILEVNGPEQLAQFLDSEIPLPKIDLEFYFHHIDGKSAHRFWSQNSIP